MDDTAEGRRSDVSATTHLTPVSDSSLDGRVIIVTGAARGIGAVVSTELAAHGASVVLADVLETGAEVAAELRDSGLEARFVPVDVASDASVRALVLHCSEAFGRVDGVVNNAGVFQDLGRKRAFTELSLGEWDHVMRVNARGPWLLTRAVFPLMRRAGFGRIVNIASATVHMGIPGFAHYVASKGAVIALTRCLAREVGEYGITVNAIAPGLVHTQAAEALNDADYFLRFAEHRAIRRDMYPEDLLGAICFLCSPAAGFITGQTLVVDGGEVFA